MQESSCQRIRLVQGAAESAPFTSICETQRTQLPDRSKDKHRVNRNSLCFKHVLMEKKFKDSSFAINYTTVEFKCKNVIVETGRSSSDGK